MDNGEGGRTDATAPWPWLYGAALACELRHYGSCLHTPNSSCSHASVVCTRLCASSVAALLQRFLLHTTDRKSGFLPLIKKERRERTRFNYDSEIDALLSTAFQRA